MTTCIFSPQRRGGAKKFANPLHRLHFFTAKTRRREGFREPFAPPRLCGEILIIPLSFQPVHVIHRAQAELDGHAVPAPPLMFDAAKKRQIIGRPGGQQQAVTARLRLKGLSPDRAAAKRRPVVPKIKPRLRAIMPFQQDRSAPHSGLRGQNRRQQQEQNRPQAPIRPPIFACCLHTIQIFENCIPAPR